MTNSLTGAAVPHVHVMLQDRSDPAATRYGALTTDSGRFSIDGVRPGTYSMTGTRLGFVMPRGERVTVTVKADDKFSDLRLQLTPTGAIAGRVTDAEGSPLEAASITVEGSPDRSEFLTDENGRFRIGGLPPGRYRVRARQDSQFLPRIGERPEIRADDSTEVHNAATYYPGALTAKQAGKVEVRAGEETPGIDIQLLGVPFVRVSGKVEGKPPGAGQAFADLRMPGSCCPGVMLNAEGRFEIWGLDPGQYSVSARWEDPEGVETLMGRIRQTAPVEFEVAGSDIDDLKLRVVPDSDIAGRLQFEDPEGPQPVTERKVSLGSLAVPVGADDSFRLEKVAAGKYVVSLSWDTAYVKSMQLGSQVIDGATLDLSNGSGGAPLTLMLSPATGSVSGIIRDEKGNPAEARVVLISDGESRGFSARYVTAKTDGAYSFPNLPPGTYRLLAVPEDDADMVDPRPGGREPDLSAYEDELLTVEIGTGEKVPRDLRRQAGE